MTEDPPGEFGCLITTFAGSGSPDLGDGGPATEAELAYPTHVFAADDGNVYVADSLHGRIRIITPERQIDTFAGVGATYGAYIDGIPATEAFLRRPGGMEIGPDGLFYFADVKHHLVRRVEADGTLTTVAGGGLPTSMGGTLGDGGPATSASLFHPSDITFDDQGNMYIADASNNRVRRVDSRGIITSVLGSGGVLTEVVYEPADPYTVLNPEALAIDRDGNLYVGHTGDIRIYNIRSGDAMVVEGTGGASSIAISHNNVVYFAIPGNNQVRRLIPNQYTSPEGKEMFFVPAVVTGTGEAGFSGDGSAAVDARLAFPHGISFDGMGNLYIADSHNNRIRIINDEGTISSVAGGSSTATSPDPVPAIDTVFNTSNGLVFDDYRNLFVTDYDLNTIRRIDDLGYSMVIAGKGAPTFGGDGGHPAEAYLNAPRAPVFDRAGNLLFIDESNDSQVIRRISPGEDGIINGSSNELITTVVGIPGAFEKEGESRTNDIIGSQAILNHPRGMDIDSHGNLYIADWQDHRILKVTPGEDGIISGEQDEFVSVIAGTGDAIVSGSGGQALEASVSFPSWLAVDSKDSIYFYEHDPIRPVIRRIDSDTGIIDVVVDHRMIDLHRPTTFTFDHNDNLYVAESTRVYWVDPETGRTVHVAGDRTGGWSPWPGGFAGDGGDARQAKAQYIQFLAVDGKGNLYFDDGNGRIRKITFVPLTDDSAPHPVHTVTPVP